MVLFIIKFLLSHPLLLGVRQDIGSVIFLPFAPLSSSSLTLLLLCVSFLAGAWFPFLPLEYSAVE